MNFDNKFPLNQSKSIKCTFIGPILEDQDLYIDPKKLERVVLASANHLLLKHEYLMKQSVILCKLSLLKTSMVI